MMSRAPGQSRNRFGYDDAGDGAGDDARLLCATHALFRHRMKMKRDDMLESDRGKHIPPAHYPWNTGPSGLGSTLCTWCDRIIYEPAVACSVAPPEGLMEMETSPGLGDRCKWEFSTRTPS
jgi:hypothetical protein